MLVLQFNSIFTGFVRENTIQVLRGLGVWVVSGLLVVGGWDLRVGGFDMPQPVSFGLIGFVAGDFGAFIGLLRDVGGGVGGPKMPVHLCRSCEHQVAVGLVTGDVEFPFPQQGGGVRFPVAGSALPELKDEALDFPSSPRYCRHSDSVIDRCFAGPSGIGPVLCGLLHRFRMDLVATFKEFGQCRFEVRVLLAFNP